MVKLLHIEWLKVKNYKAFWIFLGLYVLGLFSVNYIAYQFQIEFKKNVPLDIFPYSFPKVYQTIAWISSWLLYFPGMLMILIISNEYTFKTHRQNIIDGSSRRQFVTGKILMGLMLSAITTVFVTLNSWGFGAAISGKFSLEGIEFIGYSFVQSTCYLFFAMILAVLLRRSGLAITIFFMYGLIFEQLVGGIVDNNILKGHYFFYYMPLQVTDMLVPMPFGGNMLFKDAPNTYVLLLLSLLYISIFCFLAVRKFEKEDL